MTHASAANGAQARATALGILDVDLAAMYGNEDPSGAMFVSHVAHGDLLHLSGTVATRDGAAYLPGIVGQDVSIDEAHEAARVACVESLRVMAFALGSLDRVQRMITLTGYVNSAPDFEEQPRVINGATELLVEVFGQAGLCARAAIGCQGLAMNSSVELVMTCQFDGGEVVSALPTPAAAPLH
jgi:enamine deaminase RidA (YjgF/YER057c/UK114 family)